jgi:polyhydroxybutyrate depolymerase
MLRGLPAPQRWGMELGRYFRLMMSRMFSRTWYLPAVVWANLHSPAVAEEMRVGATARTYTVQVPAGAQKLPLVLSLHGNGQQGAQMQAQTSWATLAAKERFAVVFPDGLNKAWADLRSLPERLGNKPPAGTDDAAFLLALVDHFVRLGVADPQRIYVAGVSNGGAMALTLACQHPGRFAAVASVIMEFTPTVAALCKPAQPVPVLFMNGTDDPLIPYLGGPASNLRGQVDGAATYLSTPDTVAFWRRVNGCAVEDAASDALPNPDAADRTSVTRISSRCPAGQDVLLYRVNNGGHRMPERRHASLREPRVAGMLESVLGPQNRDISGPEVIWQFFVGFARP